MVVAGRTAEGLAEAAAAAGILLHGVPTVAHGLTHLLSSADIGSAAEEGTLSTSGR